MKNFLQKAIFPRAAGIVVALVVLASAVIGSERGERYAEREAVPARESRSAAASPAEKTPPAAVDLDIEMLRRPAKQGTAGDLFLAAIAAPTPPPRVAPSPPPAPARIEPPAPAKPSAPALPFTYLGRLTDGGRTKVFLSRNSEALSLSAGDSLDGLYEVESIAEDRIEFIYLPVGEKQTLAVAPPR